MAIIVTGGLGILGNSILKILSKNEKKIIVYDRKKNFQRFQSIKNKNMQFIAGG